MSLEYGRHWCRVFSCHIWHSVHSADLIHYTVGMLNGLEYVRRWCQAFFAL